MSHPWETYQGVYIHIPFCVQKCCYCDFASYQGQSGDVQERYVKRLIKEIETWRPHLPVSPAATVYFGGGTPTVLLPEQLGRIVAALKDKGFWQQPKEATLEANPGTVTLESLRAYRAMGFDRLSLGMQSFVPAELKAMGRIHTVEQSLEAPELAQQAGFTRISGDLIYGYPGQTVESVAYSLERLMKSGVNHISIYGLTVEEGTRLAYELDHGQSVLPSEEAAGAMYDHIMKTLPEQGFHRYEISNFAKEGQESRHNQVYWHYDPYLAFGAAACRFDGWTRETNPRSLVDYLNGRVPEREELTREERVEELVFMSLRTTKGLSLTEFQERTGKDFFVEYKEAYDRCAQKGWLEQSSQRIHLTPLGMQYGNLAFGEFMLG